MPEQECLSVWMGITYTPHKMAWNFGIHFLCSLFSLLGYIRPALKLLKQHHVANSLIKFVHEDP